MQQAQPTNVFTFQFENSDNHEVRTVLKEDGSIWFVAKDVCSAIELKTEQIRRLEDDEKNTLRLTQGIPGNPNMSIISESGLYTLVLRSDKPQAKVFRKWVTSEVLPQLRRTGAYSLEPVTDLPPAPNLKQVTAFLQVSTDAYWHAIRALDQTSIVAGELRKNKKALSAIIQSIKEVFPDARDIFDDVSVRSMTRDYDNPKINQGLPLSVEMHR